MLVLKYESFIQYVAIVISKYRESFEKSEFYIFPSF
jgi:hypothetical protein